MRLGPQSESLNHESPKAGSVIYHISEFNPEKLLVVLYMRVSTTDQRTKCNLDNRHIWLRRKIKQMGIRLHGQIFREVADSRTFQNRTKFKEAIAAAHTLQSENPEWIVAIVTDARNRFLRSTHFNGQANTDPPSLRQLREFQEFLNGVALATVLHPDLSFGEVRSHETQIPAMVGNALGKAVGRPKGQSKRPGWKRDRRLGLIAEVRRLGDEGKSNREIGRQLRVPESTVRSWRL